MRRWYPLHNKNTSVNRLTNAIKELELRSRTETSTQRQVRKWCVWSRARVGQGYEEDFSLFCSTGVSQKSSH